MQIFAAVKAAVTTREAAVFYGLRVPANGMICCPFHPDRHPSMKVDARYYCFGCHETGDVIDFVGRLFHMSPLDAARKIAADFGIDPRTPAAAAVQGKRVEQTWQRQAEASCVAVLIDYECLLKEQKDRYAPALEDATWNPAFAEAVRELPYVSHLIDLLYDADASLRRSTAARITLDGTLAKMKNRLLAARGEEVADEDCKLAG